MRSTAKRLFTTTRPPAFTGRERRWLAVTELPSLACVVAVAILVPPLRPFDPLVCLLLIGGYAVASNVFTARTEHGDAPATQLIFVPMLFLAPLNLVPLMTLAGHLLDDVIHYRTPERPLRRFPLAIGNAGYAVAPVLVLAVAGHEAFAWEYWPIYAIALASQIVTNSGITATRIRLHVGAGMLAREVFVAPAVIDTVLTVPALGVVAITTDAPVAAVLITAAMLTIAAGFTSERSRRLAERERAAGDARRALVDERVRIARELHDVVAHHVSLIGVQAAAARMVLDRDADKAKETLASIESSSRQAVHELHQLLGFLRQASDSDDVGPQPGLGQLDELLAGMRESRMAVELRVEGEPYDLAPTVDASAYRIVQEALTNTLKHASASRVDVRLQYGPDALELEIVDDGRGDGDGGPATSGGLGLIGMRERAALHGGQLTAGPRPAGGFMVRATLPAPGGAP